MKYSIFLKILILNLITISSYAQQMSSFDDSEKLAPLNKGFQSGVLQPSRLQHCGLEVSLPTTFSQLSASFDTKVCFPEENFDSLTSRSPIEKDMAVCTCLNSKSKINLTLPSMLGISDAVDTYGQKPSKESILKTYNENFQREWNKIESEKLSTALSAAILFQGRPDLTSYYNKSSEVLSEMKNKLTRRAPKDLKNVIEHIHNNIEGIDVSGLLTNNEPLDENKCVSPLEFIAYNQLPKDAILVRALKEDFKPSSFDSSLWDYDTLKTNFKQLRGPDNKDEKNKIKEKLLFLSRNPLIKATLSLKSDNPDVSKSYNENKIKLLTLINNYTADCEKNVCTPDDANRKSDKVYREQLGKFFANESVLGPVVAMGDKNLQDASDDVLKNSKNLIRKSIPNSRKEMLAAYENISGRSPESCDVNSDSFNETKCREIYDGYCPKVIYHFESLSKLSDLDEIEEDLDSLLVHESNMDFSKNISYRKFNEVMCDQKYDIKGDGKKSVSFNIFRKQSCKKETLEECRLKFHTKYKDVIIDQFGEFISFVQHAPIKYMSKPEAESVSLASDDIKKTRKKIKDKFVDFFKRDISSYEQNEAAFNPTSSITPNVTEQVEKSVASFANDPSPLPNMNDYFNNFGTNSSKQDDAQTTYSLPEKSLDEHLKQNENFKKDTLQDNNIQESKSGDDSRIVELQNEIGALRAMLENNNQKSLEEALKDKEFLKSKIANLEKEKDAKIQNRVESKLASQKENSEFEEQTLNRGPASRNTGGYQGVVNGGGVSAGFRAGESASSTVRMKEDAVNRERLARETSKLVALRQADAGTITIENPRGPASTGANAIAINITDDLYKQVRNNLAGINLEQIRGNIPKEQIALLEKKGEITLLLRNGENPPVEVKVTRKDGSLIQVPKSEAKVVREKTRESLIQTFILQNL